MKVLKNPASNSWDVLVQRPTPHTEDLNRSVEEIMNYVARKGDQGIRHFTRLLDRVDLEALAVNPKAIKAAADSIDSALKQAIGVAKQNIEKFHEAQKPAFSKVETTSGVVCWQRQQPIERVGLYIPGGSAPLFSSVLMLGIPARLAGCRDLVLCTPPQADDSVHPAILYTASLLGITKIFRVGGVQAIAGMAYGTESIPKVDKIFGPGNAYVTRAKEMAQQFGVAIDMPAGPSEVLVIADQQADPRFVAADLLSQAEHGPDSQVVLVTDSEALLQDCLQEIEVQTALLPRKSIVEKALQNGLVIQLDRLDDCLAFSNRYAPEHLIIATANAGSLAEGVTNAGSVFLGNYSCESAGDYASGTNHTLPTNGFARNYSGVTVSSFCKTITFQELSREGLCNIGEAVEVMAEAEGLMAHKNAVSVRLQALQDG